MQCDATRRRARRGDPEILGSGNMAASESGLVGGGWGVGGAGIGSSCVGPGPEAGDFLARYPLVSQQAEEAVSAEAQPGWATSCAPSSAWPARRGAIWTWRAPSRRYSTGPGRRCATWASRPPL